MTDELYIVGCGGFGREVHDIVMAINAITPTWRFAGFIDDAPTSSNLALVSQRGAQVAANLDTASDLQPASFVVGIGSPTAREAAARRLEAAGWKATILIHPSATLGSGVQLGNGAIICAGAHLTTNIHVGRHVHVDQAATIGHDCWIGDFSRLNPQACVSGNVRVAHGVTVGANATILQNLSVGANAIVGAGAVLTRSIASRTTAIGIPAHPMHKPRTSPEPDTYTEA